MRQDTDVARVAAALRAPAIRYRSFGNEPVRTPAVAPDADPYALLGAAMNAAAEVGHQQGMPPAEAWQAPPVHQPMPQATQPNWGEPPSPQAVPTQSWAEPAQQWPAPQPLERAPVQPEPQYWQEPAAEAWTAPPAPAQHWAEPEPPAPYPVAAPEPVAFVPEPPPAPPPPAPPIQPPIQPLAQPMRAEPPAAPLAMPAVPPAMPVAPQAIPVSSGWAAAPPPPAPPPREVPAPKPAAAPAGFGVGEMSLLRAADMLVAPPPRSHLSTLAELSVATAQGASQQLAPRALFPLIDALDLPGGLVARRSLPNAVTPALVEEAVPPPEPAAPPPPAVLMAAEIDLPLSELLRLLAADPDEAADAFTALRRPPRADHLDT